MLEFFTNPGYLAAGGALISAPIIIHLINRMRFKRLRWAAMEFLLKSQKRNRRRLLIEQLILLALRCLLVILVTLLVSRFVGFSFDRFSSKASLHLVLLDDTLSMSDQWKDEAKTLTCFDVAKDKVIMEQIVRNVGQSTTLDRLLIMPLTKVALEPEYEPKSYTRLNEDKAHKEIEDDLKKLRATKMHVNIRDGIERLQTIIDKNIKDNRITLHVVSDFRQRDWGKPAANELHKQLVKLANNGVKIRMVDTAHPYRVEGQGGVPICHDNVAITDLRPSTRVAGVNMPVNFTATLANFGTQDVPVHIAVHEAIKGEELKQVDLKLPSRQQGDLGPGVVMVPAGSTDTTVSFELRFPPDVAPGKKIFGQIFARLESKERGKLDKDGLPEDNLRYSAVEVRNKVPILVIDGEGENGREEGKDSFFIDRAIMSVPGNSYELLYADPLGGAKALERPDLRQFPTIFLLNVRDFDPKTRQLKNLEAFVREGGGAAFFLGPRVSPDFYNEHLYKKGAGVFPMPLSKTYYPPPSEEALKSDFTGYDQVLVRDKNNAAFASLDQFPIFGPILIDEPKMRQFFVFLPIERYFKVPRSEWRPTPGKTFELATLPNDVRITDYQSAALDIVRSPVLAKVLEAPQLDKYKRGLDRHRRLIEEAVSPTSELKARHLADKMQEMLDDKGNKDDQVNYPNLTEFWAYPDPKIRSLQQSIERLIAETRFGDAFIVAGSFGAGKVVAMTTTAGKDWNDWGGGFASALYQPFIWETQNYLSAPSQETVLNVGQPVNIVVDREQYTKKSQQLRMLRYHHKAEVNTALKTVKDTEQFGAEKGEQVEFTFARTPEPGLYVSKLVGDESDLSAALAEWGHVYNVDAASEGRLDRVSMDELNKNVVQATEKEGMIRFETPQAGGDELINRQSDLSESAWFYLVFLIILVAEQALAVHLSFHLKGGEAELPSAAVQSSRAA